MNLRRYYPVALCLATLLSAAESRAACDYAELVRRAALDWRRGDQTLLHFVHGRAAVAASLDAFRSSCPNVKASKADLLALLDRVSDNGRKSQSARAVAGFLTEHGDELAAAGLTDGAASSLAQAEALVANVLPYCRAEELEDSIGLRSSTALSVNGSDHGRFGAYDGYSCKSRLQYDLDRSRFVALCGKLGADAGEIERILRAAQAAAREVAYRKYEDTSCTARGSTISGPENWMPASEQQISCSAGGEHVWTLDGCYPCFGTEQKAYDDCRAQVGGTTEAKADAGLRRYIEELEAQANR